MVVNKKKTPWHLTSQQSKAVSGKENNRLDGGDGTVGGL